MCERFFFFWGEERGIRGGCPGGIYLFIYLSEQKQRGVFCLAGEFVLCISAVPSIFWRTENQYGIGEPPLKILGLVASVRVLDWMCVRSCEGDSN